MKIKVFILFSLLFLGIGFDGFGQYLVRQYPAFRKPIITADTVDLSVKEKEVVLIKCEKIGVIADSTYRGFANYLHKIDKKSFQKSQVYNGLVQDWKFIDSDNDKKIDFIVLLKAHNATGGEGYMCAIWKKNKKGKFDLLNSWDGTIVEINKKEGSISIKVIEHGCCASFIYCEEVYEDEKQKLEMKSQLCYTEAFDLREERTSIGVIQTQDSVSLHFASDSLVVVNDIEHPGVENPYAYEGEYETGAYAVINSNQKANVFYYKREQGLYWYFVVFSNKSIKRMVGGWWRDRNVAGWIKSKTPLKIESK